VGPRQGLDVFGGEKNWLGGPQRGYGRFWSRKNWLGGPKRGSERFWRREKLTGWTPERVWPFLEERRTVVDIEKLK
jgi:hypothetical protein